MPLNRRVPTKALREAWPDAEKVVGKALAEAEGLRPAPVDPNAVKRLTGNV